ncbi:DUF6191 domain-containing protein [Streptomyces kanamyceticus]|uniref:Regulatory protein n=1 Tax=Streptomyces kanamyceticus TaxID=1967 RepID=A0A5J6GCJ1_STRKN|nr:DUF6191 domain-containing protein [Streptomyces kanamyceticus]QEU91638.1 hypothetical protein CP970_12775 [Streptomyces kanamyceticus]
MFTPFEALFAPGRKHTEDEERRLELTRVDLADGDPGKGPIDLTSGKVVVRAPVPSSREDGTPGAEEARNSEETRSPEEA